MKRRVDGLRVCGAAILMALLAASSAAGQNATAALYGDWEYDRNATVEAILKKDKNADVSDYIGDVQISYSFLSDGRLTSSHRLPDGTGGRQQGTWRVLDEGHGRLSIHYTLSETGELSISYDTQAAIRISDSKAYFDLTDGGLMVLKRPSP